MKVPCTPARCHCARGLEVPKVFLLRAPAPFRSRRSVRFYLLRPSLRKISSQRRARITRLGHVEICFVYQKLFEGGKVSMVILIFLLTKIQFLPGIRIKRETSTFESILQSTCLGKKQVVRYCASDVDVVARYNWRKK